MYDVTVSENHVLEER